MHIGIILDGNRRYAKQKRLKPWEGHRFGADKVAELLKWAEELSIDELTLYTFSLENFNRTKKEVDTLFDLFITSFRKKVDISELKKKGVRIRFIGRLEFFPKKVLTLMQDIMDKTKDHKKYTVNFAMGYGGRAEIVDAVKRIVLQIEQGNLDKESIDEELITKNLYLADEPDLIIRPGGEKRVSNFLIWQSYYSEWYFTDTLWPEFTKKDLLDALGEFKARARRYGK